jgi:hypothetical protein
MLAVRSQHLQREPRRRDKTSVSLATVNRHSTDHLAILANADVDIPR